MNSVHATMIARTPATVSTTQRVVVIPLPLCWVPWRSGTCDRSRRRVDPEPHDAEDAGDEQDNDDDGDERDGFATHGQHPTARRNLVTGPSRGARGRGPVARWPCRSVRRGAEPGRSLGYARGPNRRACSTASCLGPLPDPPGHCVGARLGGCLGGDDRRDVRRRVPGQPVRAVLREQSARGPAPCHGIHVYGQLRPRGDRNAAGRAALGARVKGTSRRVLLVIFVAGLAGIVGVAFGCALTPKCM